VFLASKVRDMPVSLEEAASAYFMLQLKLIKATPSIRTGGPSGATAAVPVLTATSFTRERADHYRMLIEAEEAMLLEACAFDFDALHHLPYGPIRSFCDAHAQFASREHLHGVATAFCNDSFKLPLTLAYHPKVVAAACVQSAMLFRAQQGCQTGVDKLIHGHPWYKWIDSAIEMSDIQEVVGHIKMLYAKKAPANPPVSSNSGSRLPATT
jgi:hypothetical protein